MDIFGFWLHQALGLHLQEEKEREEKERKKREEAKEKMRFFDNE